ncbi:hypothetical protein QAD02_005345 [Eretmocerus hayati]|uniref:Uncharacterized protein n=1 Tax=Eretmocerus hayati TaxID=131215 RepID=A0ACC2NT92_9HYME|nr:hypothetical protein QAD02_005345 [Eretmocerus hayati]
MASDEPDRDCNPTGCKDGSSFFDSSCPCSVIDPRERAAVCKLDRYELEDRYLRALEELSSWKKLANSQEDKIKRLATKLLRFGANPHGLSPVAVELSLDHDKLLQLQADNAKLKEKLCVVKNQLANGKIFQRSPSRPRKLSLGTSSAPLTCRSENSRLKTSSCQCVSSRTGADGNDVQNYCLRIQELEVEKKQLLSRISELEAELCCHQSSNRREKVAENVEYIRLWRQMKRQNEKLSDSEAANETLREQVDHLKKLLDEACKHKEQICQELDSEREQVARLDESICQARASQAELRASQAELREREQRIADLKGELQILQHHNKELLELSSKFGRIEQENCELKRKLADQCASETSLRQAVCKEKANTDALQAANEELLAKLNELQCNIDTMTIKLVEQNKKFDARKQEQSANTNPCCSAAAPDMSPEERRLEEEMQNCKKCCEEDYLRQKAELERINNQTTVDVSTQTESAKSKKNSVVESYDRNKNEIHLPPNGNSLSREGMLKLLEKVQINTPLESHDITRIGSSRPISNLESLLFGDTNY